jgi:hypothetical protein
VKAESNPFEGFTMLKINIETHARINTIDKKVTSAVRKPTKGMGTFDDFLDLIKNANKTMRTGNTKHSEICTRR